MFYYSLTIINIQVGIFRDMSQHYDRGPGPIPKRWLKCPRKAAKLLGDKFLAFKTPLDERYDDQISEPDRFPPSMLFNSMKSYKVSFR